MNEPLAVGRVIGEVVDTFTPSVKLTVTYNLNKIVCNGHELMPNVITSKPRVDIGGEDMRSAYTLVTLFPTLHLLYHDRSRTSCPPLNPYLREHHHRKGILVDYGSRHIPGTTDASFGKEIVSYEIPKPVIGIHRYVFLLFKQKTRKSVTPPASRDHFNTRSFCHKHGLGLPVAAVYFNAQRENAARRR
ncbi:CEN-like protein 1 [Tanacetum coccineum]|uniref:CEN-like protein 1 n=1 Tax=Tanacetum coccineum TaxID=301880 RepID=A0ABQ5C3D5_9ASTR